MDADRNDQEFEINGRQKVTLTSPLGNTKDNHKQTEMSLMTEWLQPSASKMFSLYT